VSSRDREDPTLLLVIAAGVLAALIWRALSHLRVDEVLSVIQTSLPVVSVVGVIVALLALLRVVLTRKALRSRIGVVVVPADELDPSPEAVLRFAAQLSRLGRTVRGWLDRRASAIRVRLEPDPEGRLAYVLEVPHRSGELLRSALRGYEGLELRKASDVFAHRSESPGGTVVRAELVLARPSIEPLARLALDPDPLQPFAAAIKALRARQGDRAVVCLDLLPAPAWRRARLHRRLERQARRLHSEAPSPLDGLRAGRGRRLEPAELAERRAAARALDAKLEDSGPLFELQVLMRCRAADPARAKAALQGLLAGFEQLADRNWLRVAGLPIPGLAFLGPDLPGRRSWFDRRLRTGLFRPARPGVVTAREVAGFLKPPTVHCNAENALRSGALVPPPPDLPTFDHQRGLLPLGRVASDDGERLVGVEVADTLFSYVAGRSRYGKTELAVAQFLHLVRSGHGGLFLDPHEDAVQRIKRHLAGAGLRERVVEINLAGRGASESQPAWNVFELGASGAGEAEARVEAMVDAFSSALRWDERNTRAINLTTQAAQALAAIARVLPAELCPTIFQLPTLLSDEEWRRACLPFLAKASRRFWLDRFPRLAEEAITPVTNLVDRLRASSAITALLGQSRSTYRVREAMDRGLAVLACPGSGGTHDRLVANLIVFDLLHAAKGRAELPHERRRPFFCFLDEVQTYDGASSGNLAALLEQTAKYGVRAFLLNQNPERLTPPTLNAVTTNRSHLLAAALNARAAGLIAREWGGEPHPTALTRLPRYRFLAQVTHRGELTKPFLLRGVPVEELFDEGAPEQLEELKRAIDRTAGRRPAGEALAHLDSLDERILAELKRVRRGEGRATPAAADLTRPIEGRPQRAVRPTPLRVPTRGGRA
jgi:hypothetical protein